MHDAFRSVVPLGKIFLKSKSMKSESIYTGFSGVVACTLPIRRSRAAKFRPAAGACYSAARWPKDERAPGATRYGAAPGLQNNTNLALKL
jgi:hypothetical protein